MHRIALSLALALTLPTGCASDATPSPGAETVQSDSVSDASVADAGDAPVSGPTDTSSAEIGPPDTSVAADVAADASEEPPTLPPDETDDWCDRAALSPPGTDLPILALSVAHARVRFFGVVDRYVTADVALAGALAPEDALSTLPLAAYASALAGVCALPAHDAPPLGPASVTLAGDVALVRPGTGDVLLPASAKAVALDLRDLAPSPGLADALAAAASPALSANVPRPKRRVRTHSGMTDQLFNQANVYSTGLWDRPQPPIPAAGTKDLPLLLVTSRSMPPEAADLALSLRLAGRAWLGGEPVAAAVAESQAVPVGDWSLAIRVADLIVDGERVPDLVPADFAPDGVDAAIGDPTMWAGPPPPVATAATRPAMVALEPFGDHPPVASGRGELRAALVTIHGAVRLFFPYFGIVGDHVDERLQELLADDPATEPDRARIEEALRRFSEVLHDGHSFVWDLGSGAGAGVFAVVLDHEDGVPVIRRSAVEGVDPGDTITAIDGVPAAEWYEAAYQLVSAATDGYRADLASRLYLAMEGPTSFDLAAPDGTQASVLVAPKPAQAQQALGFAPSLRPSGWLDDEGAPELYFLNMSSDVEADLDAVISHIDEAHDALGLIVDMRGYPGVDQYAVARHLIPGPFQSPHFTTPTWQGPDHFEQISSQYPMTGDGDAYEGPIVLLTGPVTVSAAENFSQMLRGADRVTVVGRESAGTNGNITAALLPGDFGLSFTGMLVQNPDGSQFHGIGILPDVPVTPTPADLRDGVDTELEAAISVLTGGG